MSLTLLSVIILWPRVRITGEFSRDRKTFGFSSILFSLAYDNEAKEYSFTVFRPHFPILKTIGKDEPAPEPPKPAVHPSRPANEPPQRKSPQLSVASTALRRPPKPTKRIKVRFGKPKKVKKNKKSPFNLGVYWAQRGLFIVLMRKMTLLALKLIKSFRIDYIRSRIVIASNDPALTGIAYGTLSPLLILNHTKRVEIDLSAEFDDSDSQFEMTAALSFRPLLVFAIASKWLTTLPWPRMIKFFFSERRRSKTAHETT